MPLKNSNIPDYKVWAVDNIVYGPVDFQTLEAWVEDERVNEDTWIYRMSTDSWTKADSYPEFEKYFQLVEEEEAEANRNKNHIEINHRNLRRIKLLSLFDDTQLEELSLYLEYKRVDPYTLIVRRLTPSDSMYFILEGEVIHGAELGRKIGFPTANINYPKEIVKIPFGVYAAQVNGMSAVLNWGMKPTVHNTELPVVETHILNYSGNLYGKTLKIELFKRIRGEKCFNNLEELKKQIDKDIQACSTL